MITADNNNDNSKKLNADVNSDDGFYRLPPAICVHNQMLLEQMGNDSFLEQYKTKFIYYAQKYPNLHRSEIFRKVITDFGISIFGKGAASAKMHMSYNIHKDFYNTLNEIIATVETAAVTGFSKLN